MTEEKLNALRQQDTNLRDAIWQDETERPQMPADLNERLMQRVAAQKEKKQRRIVWPWIAAACAAGVLMIWLTPPKVTETDVVAKQQPKVEKSVEVVKPQTAEAKPEASQPVEETTIAVKPVKVSPAKPTINKLLAQETSVTEPTAAPMAEEAHQDLAVAETTKSQPEMVTLTERDIPITRPENYRYTPEELALMKKQANEAYLKWVELELEIAKFDLENTAQK
ncbi:MAG: hypothetical protein J6T38_04945 [Bacteroidaceae bacterium]|nr:hypothetical protein [Bacteroidaceae bacterium]